MAITKIQSESMNLADTYAFTGTVTGAGESNVPAFEATRSANQDISDATYTKIQFNVETFDTASAYDNSTNYRYTPQTAGKYFVYARVQCDAQAASNLKQAIVRINKNGSTYTQSQSNEADNQAENINIPVHAVIDMNGSSDYLEVSVFIDDESGSPTIRGTSYPWSLFGAFLLTT